MEALHYGITLIIALFICDMLQNLLFICVFTITHIAGKFHFFPRAPGSTSSFLNEAQASAQENFAQLNIFADATSLPFRANWQKVDT